MAGILKVDQIQNTAGVNIMDLQNDEIRVWNGSGYSSMATPGALISINTFTSQNGTWNSKSTSGGSGTWTKPNGCGHVLVYVTGGGGGARVNDNSYRGAGGGGGATSIKYIDVSSVNSVNYTYGGGGGYARNGGRGGTGGTSSFGSYCTATGGQGGQTDNPYQGGPWIEDLVTLTYLAVVVKCHTVQIEKVDQVQVSGINQWFTSLCQSRRDYSRSVGIWWRLWLLFKNGFAHNNCYGGAGCVIVYNYT